MPVVPRLFDKLNIGGGVLGFPPPTQFPNLELYLDSRLGITGNDGDRIATIPDQSGKARNAASAGNVQAQLRKIIANGASPNGSQTLQFDGRDAPNTQWYSNNSANLNPWPSAANGYSFYWVANLRAPNNASGIQLLWEEGGTDRFRIVPEGTGTKYEYRDTSGTNFDTTTNFVTGWQSGRFIVTAPPGAGAANYYLNGSLLSWAGLNPYTDQSNVMSGYVLAQLGSNNVVGMSMFFGAFVWYSVAHSAATQKLIDNYLRFSFGLSLL